MGKRNYRTARERTNHDEYCQLIEEPTHRFYYWKRRLAEQSRLPADKKSVGFIEVLPVRSFSETALSNTTKLKFESERVRFFFTETTNLGLFKSVATALLELVG
ncbi:MAG TPA: hypothetical protein PLG43_10300 [Spirochaetia bacterium]|nr:hypothetical protein [Spirochaetia bacterium]